MPGCFTCTNFVAKTFSGARRDFEQVKKLMEEYGVEEGFVYNYDTGAWFKNRLSTGQDTRNPSFCDAIGVDLSDLLH